MSTKHWCGVLLETTAPEALDHSLEAIRNAYYPVKETHEPDRDALVFDVYREPATTWCGLHPATQPSWEWFKMLGPRLARTLSTKLQVRVWSIDAHEHFETVVAYDAEGKRRWKVATTDDLAELLSRAWYALADAAPPDQLLKRAHYLSLFPQTPLAQLTGELGPHFENGFDGPMKNDLVKLRDSCRYLISTGALTALNQNQA